MPRTASCASSKCRRAADSIALLPPRSTIFISYRSSDGAECARLLHEAFSAREIRAFLAPGHFAVGEVFPEQLRRRIAQARIFVLVLTPDALAALADRGSWVAREVAHARQLGKRFAIVRVRVPPLTRAVLPDDFQHLADLHSVELKSEAYFDAMMEELSAGVGTSLPGL